MAARKLAGADYCKAFLVTPEGRVRTRQLGSGCHDPQIEYDAERLSDRFYDRGRFPYRVRSSAKGYLLLQDAYRLDSRKELSSRADRSYVERMLPFIERGVPGERAIKSRWDQDVQDLVGEPMGYVMYVAFEKAADRGDVKRVRQNLERETNALQRHPVNENRKDHQIPKVMMQFPENLLPEIVIARRRRLDKYAVDPTDLMGNIPAPNIDAGFDQENVARSGIDPAELEALRKEAAVEIDAAKSAQEARELERELGA